MSTAATAQPHTPTSGSRDSLAGFLLLVCVGLLVLTGLAVLFSATRAMHDDSTLLLQKQLVWLAVGALAGGAAALFPLDRLRGFTWLIALGSIALLVLVLVPGIGVKVNGAQRWIGLGPMRLQAAEFAKLGLVFLLAHYLGGRPREVRTFLKGFLVPCACIGVWCALIFLQPDFGTAFLCGAVGGCLLFLAGVRFLFLIPTGLAGLAGFAWMVMNDPVRWRRITAFLDVEGNRTDSSYQLWQGLLAFASGGVEGVGLGHGRQQMHFLPEAHTDFIFAVLGEELGLWATGSVVVLFLAIFLLVNWQVRRAPDLFHFLLVQGIMLFLVFQALINLGVVTGLLPTKGMSLPFISYGGSNLVLMCIFTGLLLNAFRSWDRPVWSTPREL